MVKVSLLQKAMVLVGLTCLTATGIIITKQEGILADPCGSDPLSRFGCTLDPFNPSTNNGNGSGRNWFAIYFKNNCNVPIQVAILQYFPADTGGGRGSQSGVALYISEKWEPRGWWRLEPGERALLANQDINRNFYYYAESIGGEGIVWSGNDAQDNLKGRDLSFKKVNMGERFVDFTQSLSCSSAR